MSINEDFEKELLKEIDNYQLNKYRFHYIKNPDDIRNAYDNKKIFLFSQNLTYNFYCIFWFFGLIASGAFMVILLDYFVNHKNNMLFGGADQLQLAIFLLIIGIICFIAAHFIHTIDKSIFIVLSNYGILYTSWKSYSYVPWDKVENVKIVEVEVRNTSIINSISKYTEIRLFFKNKRRKKFKIDEFNSDEFPTENGKDLMGKTFKYYWAKTKLQKSIENGNFCVFCGEYIEDDPSHMCS